MTNLESAVIGMLLEGDHPALAALRSQLAACSVVSRELTGAGFYTRLAVKEGIAPAAISEGTVRLGDVDATIEGLKHGAGFYLEIKNGFISSLEGFSFEERWPENTDVFELNYQDGARDLAKLPL